MGFHHSPKISTDGIIGLWDAGNKRSYSGSGSTFSDALGSGYNFSMVGTPTYQNGYFSGFSDSNYFSMSTNFPTPGTGDFSYCFWVYLSNITSIGTLLEIRNPSTTFIVRTYLSATDPLYINFASTEFKLPFDLPPAANAWSNLVVTRSGTTVRGFCNGVPSTSTGTSNQSITGSVHQFGKLNVASIQWLNGNYASFAAYNRALSANEVSENFNALRSRFGI